MSVTSAEDNKLGVEALAAKLETALALNEALREKVAVLEARLQLFEQWRFGRSSERMEPGQLDLFRTGEAPVVSEPEPVQPAPRPKKKGHGRPAFPAHLPRNVVVLDVPESERVCSCCGGALHLIGAEITERGRLIPARMVVDRFERPKYACSRGHEVKTAQLPDGVIDGGKYDASVYAHAVVAKYQDHLPLNRLEGIFKRYGVQLAKQTLWDLILRVDELVAQPVLTQMKEELLREEVLHADETAVTLRYEDQKKKSGSSWIFSWRSLREVAQPKALVEFRPGRGRDGPTGFLGDYAKTLIIDGYTGYDEVCEKNGIRRAGCWAHARRYFKEALDTGARESVLVLRPINRLFRIERAVNARADRLGLDLKARRELRRATRERFSVRVIAAIRAANAELDAARTTLPKSKLGKAVRYLFNQSGPLEVFLEDPAVPIHNNDAERDLRHVVTGRKNWLFFASERGGQAAARLYSLMLSCRQNEVDPERYIADVLMAVATTPSSKIATLTPWAWAEHQAEAAAAV